MKRRRKVAAIVLIGTMVGHLLSCVYYRAGLCCPDGHCKATWIAKVFGLSLRRVKHVRHELEALGILQRHDAPQWVLNHYGVDLTINTAVGRSTTRRRAEHDTILTDVSRSCCIVSRKRPKR